jgi:hypothetical protein
MEDLAGGVYAAWGLYRHSVRAVGSRNPKMAGDIASGVVHGL